LIGYWGSLILLISLEAHPTLDAIAIAICHDYSPRVCLCLSH
jgi:hypothetical protein